MPKSEQKPVPIAARSDLEFLGHTKWSDFSMFGFQTVSEILFFERVPLASKWHAAGFFGFVLTLPH